MTDDAAEHAKYLRYLSRVPGIERMTGQQALFQLREHDESSMRVSRLSEEIQQALKQRLGGSRRAMVAAVTLGWLGDVPRAQIALASNGYALHAGIMSAAALDAAAGLPHWCRDENSAEQWRTHDERKHAGYQTKKGLTDLSVAVAQSYKPCGAAEQFDADAVAEKWHRWYAEFSMVKHANPIAVKETRTHRTAAKQTRVVSGPEYCPNITQRAGIAIDASITIFLATALASCTLLEMPPDAAIIDAFTETLRAD